MSVRDARGFPGPRGDLAHRGEPIHFPLKFAQGIERTSCRAGLMSSSLYPGDLLCQGAIQNDEQAAVLWRSFSCLLRGESSANYAYKAVLR